MTRFQMKVFSWIFISCASQYLFSFVFVHERNAEQRSPVRWCLVAEICMYAFGHFRKKDYSCFNIFVSVSVML